jgi:hypothetical protein
MALASDSGFVRACLTRDERFRGDIVRCAATGEVAFRALEKNYRSPRPFADEGKAARDPLASAT